MLTIHGGRTRRLWPYLERQAAQTRARGDRCLVLVPEQYTLQAERSLIAGLRLPGFFDIEVFSYSRLIQRLFLLRGTAGHVRVDANGKGIAVARALAGCAGEMRYFGRAASRPGFAAQMGEWIGDLKRACVTPEKLLDYAAALPEGAYADKLHDLTRVYAAYEALLADKFVDGEDVIAKAMQNAREAGFLRGADVLVYGFDVITDDFARLLCAITAVCRQTHVYLVMEREDAPDGDYFAPVRDSAQRLRGHCDDSGVARQWLWADDTPLDAPQDIAFLEKRLLCGASATYDAPPEHIELTAAATPYAEVQAIAQTVAALLEEGAQPEALCVLCGDMPRYAPLFDAVFSAYRLPAYIAVKEPLLSHGVIRLLLSALRTVTGGYRREDVLEAAKSGFAPIAAEDGWALENYALKYGVNGARWRQAFTRGSEEERQAPERARQRLIQPMERMQGALRASRDGAQSLRALADFLADCGAYQTLLEQEDALMRAGMYAQAVRARQVWARVLALFEQMHELAGGARIAARVMASWIEAGLAGDAISALPPAVGCVTVGAIGNVLPFEPDVVFACALQGDGAAKPESGPLTPAERERVSADLRAHLGMDASQRELLRELDLWKALSAPRKRLYLSHAQATQDGAALRPAQALSAIRRLFPRLTEIGGVSQAPWPLHPFSPQPALDAMGALLRGGALAGEWLSAWKWLLADAAFRPSALALLSAARGESEGDRLPADIARALFTDRVMSVSRLESYAACPYSHFVQYGLRPQERARWEISASDTGVFYHAAMEGFTRALAADERWPAISRKECDALMDRALQPLTEQWKEQVMGDSARARAEGRRYTRVCKRVAWAFTQGAQQSDFKPMQGEIAFGYPDGPPPLRLLLDDGQAVYVRGRIDRVDVFETPTERYLRVIDYKSGQQTLDPARIWAGMQLQLLLYLEAATEAFAGALPAGAYYQWMGDPVIDHKKKETLEREIAKKLCLKGVSLSDAEILQHMDRLSPPVSMETLLKQDGTVRQGKLACTLEDMRALLASARGTAARLTQELRRGKIAAQPVSDREYTACQWCDFAGVCRRDARAQGAGRALEALDFETLLARARAGAQIGEST